MHRTECILHHSRFNTLLRWVPWTLGLESIPNKGSQKMCAGTLNGGNSGIIPKMLLPPTINHQHCCCVLGFLLQDVSV